MHSYNNFNTFIKQTSVENIINIDKLKNCDDPIYILGDGEYSKLVHKFLLDHQITVKAHFITNGDDLLINGNSFDSIKDSYICVIGIANHEKAQKLIENLKEQFKNCTQYYYFCLNPFYNVDHDLLYSGWDRICVLVDMLNDDESKKIIYSYLSSAISFNNDSLIPSTPQYFPPFFHLSDKEIVVSGGAYIGDTLEEYIKLHKSFHEYHAFEPSLQNFSILSQNRNLKNLFLYNKGLGLSNETLSFHDGDSSTTTSSFDISTFNNENLKQVQIVRLDDIISKVTFIKLDIEGSELDALIGSAKLISVCKPKIAVCIYHKFVHLWQIIDFLKSLRSDYKFSVRYHSTSKILTELVLYAY